MSGDRTTTSFGAIDGPTTRYLARVASNINFLLKDCSTSPTDERLFKQGVDTYRVGQLEIDGAVVTIYSFNSGDVFNRLNQQTDDAGEEISQFFAVDWPVKQDNGRSYNTFYFKTRPCEERIKMAHCIHKVKIAIENRELLQEFRCQNCSERVHWTNLRDDEDMTLLERVVFLQKQVCNCEESLSVLREGTDTENAVEPEIATETTTGRLALSLD